MIPWYRKSRRIGIKPPPPWSSRVEHVYLLLPNVYRPRNLDPFTDRVGVIEDYIGDEVLVRFGEVVVQVPAEWVVPAEE